MLFSKDFFCPRPSFSAIEGEKRGFALLITITLLAFLVLLLVSLATLTRVETQVASNNQELALSRQNALFALNLALGQLQQNAGPDRRVTAPSNTGNATTAPGRSDNQPYWTGVWRNTPPTGASIAEEMYSPELLTWLVSGNESSIKLNPNDTITEPTADPGSPTVWLVGEGGVDATASPDPRIKLPKVDINASVPGFTGTPIVGRYAWWVGDEGVKARAGLSDPYATTPTTPEGDLSRLLSSQRSAVEQMSSDMATFPKDLATVRKLVFVEQLPLAAPAVPVMEWKRRFHDMGVQARGVLSDTRNGGLRRDLTYLLSRPNLSDFRSEIANAWTDTGTTPAVDPYGTYRLAEPGVSIPASFHVWSRSAPTWEQLRSYFNLSSDVDASGVVVPRAQTATAHGVFPIVARMRLYFGLRRERVGADENRIYLHARPSLVLANPYNVTMAAGTYHVAVDFRQGYVGVQFSSTSAGEYRFGNWAALYNRIKFRVEAEAIPPGEARIFSLKWADTTNNPSWDATTLSYEQVSDGTYTMVNDYDDGQSSLRLASGMTFTNAECDAARLFGGQSEFGVVLWNDSPSDYQTVLQFSDRSTGSSMVMGPVGLPAPETNPDVVWGGGFYYLLTDAGTYSATGGNLFVNYVQEVNLRAPARSGQHGTSSSGVRFPVMTNGGAQRNTESHFVYRQKVAADNKRVAWGLSYQDTSTLPQVVFENIAYAVPRANAPLVSLGQLQHFNAGGFIPTGTGGLTVAFGEIPTDRPDTAVQELAFNPAQAIGHSRAPRLVRRDEVYTDQGATAGAAHDASYLLNTALWDRFYFSTIPQSGTFDFAAGHLANSRYKPYRPNVASSAIADYRDSATAASENLLVEGAFNVNSTSAPAWRALLAGLLGVPFSAEQGDDQAPFPRTPFQSGGSAQANDGVSSDAWKGFRMLSATEINDLATAIVTEVRNRGPFISLADFVNRRIVSAAADTNGTGIMGALEAAIQRAALNPGPPAGSNFSAQPPDRNNQVDAAHKMPNLIAGYPGWLTQADLLQPLAPVLTARSDTFRIRAYGESVNPATGMPSGRAWCEAVVQRMPDFVGGEPAETSLADPALSDSSRRFGRRFQVVSFRWLAPGDI